MYIAPVLPSKRSSHAQKAYLARNQPFLVECNGSVLYARPISDSDLSSGPNRSIRLDAGIDAIALYTLQVRGDYVNSDSPSHERIQGILALSNDTIHFIELSSAGLYIRSKLPLAIVQGHSRPLEHGPCVQVYSNGRTEFLVIYAVARFLTVVDLGGLFASKGSKQPYRTFPIGNIVVVRLTVLPKSSPTPAIVILYRDIDFNYSLRYYGVDRHLENLSVLRQMELFSVTPSHVITSHAGCHVFSDLKIWFFPGPWVKVLLANSAADDTTLSLSSTHNVVTKSVDGHVIGSKVTCATQIDDSRYLYVTDTGSTHMLFFQSSGNNLVHEVSDFQVLNLGKSTIANSLVHMTDNVFYAGSHLSRSLIFQIRTSQPYIHVAKTLTNSPPILDLAMGSDVYSQEMWISRGGFHNGEVHLYAGTNQELIQSAEIALTSSANDIRFASEDSIFLYENGKFTGKLCADQNTWVSQMNNDILHSTSAANVFPHPSRLFTVSDARRWQIGSQELTLENGVFAYNGVSINPHMTEITDMVCYMNDNILHVLVASWGGTLAHLKFGKEPAQEKVETGGKGHTSICRTKDMVFSIDGNGDIYQSRGFQGESRLIPANANEGGFKLVGGPDHVLVCSSNSIYVLDGTDFSLPKRIHMSLRRIKSFDLHDTKVAILFDDNSVAIFEIESVDPHANAYHSDKVILKTLVFEKWIVALEMGIVPDMHTRTPQRVMSLLVLDSRTLQVLSKEPAEKGLVDICTVSTEDFPVLVGACTGCKSEDTLAVYWVQKGRIRKLNVPINGVLPKTATIARMTSYANHVCVVGNVVLQFTLKSGVPDRENGPKNARLFWTGQVIENNATPFFFVDVAWSHHGLVLADANRGLFFRANDGPVQKLMLEYPPSYPTAVAILKNSPVVIYGDAEGNLGAVWVNSGTHRVNVDIENGDLSYNGNSGNENEDNPFLQTLIAANISEQINTIMVTSEDPLKLLVGTVQGSVYCVSHGDDGEELAESWVHPK